MYLNVSCAIIEHQGLVLAVQRNANMDNPLLWEFPGGKVEEGESAANSIVREIKEELGISIQITGALNSSTHSGNARNIRLLPFICRWVGGTLQLHEHADARWLQPAALSMLPWCPADVPIVEDYINIRT